MNDIASPAGLQTIRELLARISADDYGVWFEVGCALKHLGMSYEVFRDWSATSKKFDKDECANKWEELPSEPRAGLPTLLKYAAASSFKPIPEEMLPPPQTEDECAKQAARYFVTRFNPGEDYELCGWKNDPHRENHLIPDRNVKRLIRLEEGETEEVLSQDKDIRTWLQDGILNGVVVSQNPLSVPPDFKGYAPTDAIVSRYDIALVESDGIPISEQWARLKQMRLPILSVVHSGHESLHIACRIDAGMDAKLYKERVNMLYDYVRGFGFVPDENCKNASRLTRLPGAMRDGKRQHLVCGSCGYSDWETFELCELNNDVVATTAAESPAKGIAPQIQHNRAPATEASCDPEDQALHDELEKEFGEPLTLSSKGTVTMLNESFWAAFVLRKRGLSKVFGITWKYVPANGLWKTVSDEEMNNMIIKTAHEYGSSRGLSDLVMKFNEPTCNHVRKFMKSAETDPFKDRPHNLIHVGNGMLEINDDGTCVLKPFSPDYYSRNQTSIAYDPAAQCPRFKGELLEPMLPQDDIEVLQRYCGQCLLGVNITQTFLVLTGTPGGGKGTIVNLIRAIIGGDNCVEMRTEHLGERFELARFIGKTFLTGSDVPSDFLLKKSAGKIKSLCGWDLLCAEIKGVTEPIPMIGNFNIVITANDRLKVNVDGDIGAWRRRMLWITFENQGTDNPVTDFAGVLLREEGPGILNWMIEGAVKVLQGGFPRESLSSKRVERLLQESNSIYGFLTNCIEKTDSGPGISIDDLGKKYHDWCIANDWEPLYGLETRRKLTRGLESLFHVPQAHNIVCNGCNLRGYHGVAFKADVVSVGTPTTP